VRGVPTFYIHTQIATAQEVIDAIGIAPDDSWSLGDLVSPNHPKYKTRQRNTMLEFEAEPPNGENGSYVEAIHAVLDRLEPAREKLLALRERCLKDGIDITYRIASFDFIPLATVAWFELGLADLKRIASFKAKVDCELVWESYSKELGVEWESNGDRGFYDDEHWRWKHSLETENDGDSEE
jgi:hypothetical protein